MDENSVTHEEVMRVRRYECGVRGHTFDVIQTVGEDDPRSVLCSNCGKDWAVQPSDTPAARPEPTGEAIRNGMLEIGRVVFETPDGIPVFEQRGPWQLKGKEALTVTFDASKITMS